jgi:hypothetical protein
VNKLKIAFTAPGPSPWSLRPPSARLSTAEGEWTWGFYDEPGLAGLSRLISPYGESVLFLDFSFYVQLLPGDKLLIWHESGRQAQDRSATPGIAFTILTLSALIPFDAPQVKAKDIRTNKTKIGFQGGNPRFYVASTTLSEGTHPISTPPEFSGLPEVLVLADFGPADMASNHWDKMCRAIFAFDFKSQAVTVFPQNWFNDGKYDFGYQWISRVQREPATGQIVGQGVRLGEFRLDSSGTQIQEWLHKDPFYHSQ